MTPMEKHQSQVAARVLEELKKDRWKATTAARPRRRRTWSPP